MADGQRGLKEGTPSRAVAWRHAHVGGTRPPGRTAGSVGGRWLWCGVGLAPRGPKVTAKHTSPEAPVSLSKAGLRVPREHKPCTRPCSVASCGHRP